MVVTGEVFDSAAFRTYAYPPQQSRFYLALVFAFIAFPALALLFFFGMLSLVLPVLVLLLWVGTQVFFAYLLGNAILVSPMNYPRIHMIAEDLKVKMGYAKPVSIFVYEQGNFNAGLTQRFFRRAIFLNSEILETGVSDDEVRWVIGRFIGYLRTRELAGVFGWLIRTVQHLLVFNVFILPYERAMVYTGDRIALAAIGGDVSSAISAMQKVMVGRQLGYSVNPEGIIDQQRRIKGSFFAFLGRLMSSFPAMTTRYVDLIVFASAYFPEHFAEFAAANPGLPGDLPRLAACAETGLPPRADVVALASSNPR